MSDSTASGGRRAAAISGLIVVLTLLILARGAPVIAAYIARFRQAHSPGALAATMAILAAVLCVLWAGIWKRPRATALVLGLMGLALVVTTGNALALVIALALAGFTVLAGDWLSRLFRGREAEPGELTISIAVGAVAIGGSLLLLGEAGLANPVALAAVAVLLVIVRRRRLPELGRVLWTSGRAIGDRRYSALESLWLAIVVAVIGAGFLGTLRPDVSFDALSYHLPEIRDFADRGRVQAFPQIPESRLWHNYDTFLGAGFLAGGERAVRFLHFIIGLCAFAAAATLARRLGWVGAGPLVLLALAAFPAGSVQLEETYVDLFAALCLTAAAAEIAASGQEPRRGALGGFLFGGAVATKIFALLGLPALLILLIRRHPGSRRLLAFVLCAAIPLAPWFAWSQSRSGFFLSPYSDPFLKGPSSLIDGTYIQPRPWPGMAPTGLAGFFSLPFDRTFRLVRFSSSADGVTGFLPLLLLLGAAGWGRRRLALFAAAALAALVPWYVLSGARFIFPSIRFLISLYPLYAVFTALGIVRLTEEFRGRWGMAAGLSLGALAIAFPAQFFSTPYDVRVALGRVSREQALSAYLPAYPLWKQVRPEDRVLLVGEWDRYHCPARYSVRDVDLPIQGHDSGAWQSEMRRLQITHVLFRSGQKRGSILESLEKCAEELGRTGTAALYRINWDREGCSGAPPGHGAAKSDFVASPQISQRVTVGKRVSVVEDVLSDAGDPGAPADRGNDRGIGSDLGLADQPAREGRPQNPLVNEISMERKLPLGMEHGHLGAGTGPARRPVEGSRPG